MSSIIDLIYIITIQNGFVVSRQSVNAMPPHQPAPVHHPVAAAGIAPAANGLVAGELPLHNSGGLLHHSICTSKRAPTQ